MTAHQKWTLGWIACLVVNVLAAFLNYHETGWLAWSLGCSALCVFCLVVETLQPSR